MDEVLARALTRKPEPITWEEDRAKAVEPAAADGEDEASALTAH